MFFFVVDYPDTISVWARASHMLSTAAHLLFEY